MGWLLMIITKTIISKSNPVMAGWNIEKGVILFRCWSFLKIDMVNRIERIMTENVFDISVQEFLMLLLVIQTRFNQVCCLVGNVT